MPSEMSLPKPTTDSVIHDYTSNTNDYRFNQCESSIDLLVDGYHSFKSKRKRCEQTDAKFVYNHTTKQVEQINVFGEKCPVNRTVRDHFDLLLDFLPPELAILALDICNPVFWGVWDVLD